MRMPRRETTDLDSAEYWIPQHIFLCVNGAHVIFLDVNADRYRAIPVSEAAKLTHLVAGWPVSDPSFNVRDERTRLSASKLAIVLEKQGLLTRNAQGAKAATPVRIESPTDTTVADYYEKDVTVHALEVGRFLRASLGAVLQFRMLRLHQIIARICVRNAHSINASGSSLTTIARSVAVYGRLRPLCFAALDQCVLQSLALSTYLAGEGVFPRWVFGVQADPFQAHCWLQLGSVVLNDTVENVRGLTPIMVI